MQHQLIPLCTTETGLVDQGGDAACQRPAMCRHQPSPTTRHRRHRHFVSRPASLVSLNDPQQSPVKGKCVARGALPCYAGKAPNTIFAPLLIVQFNKFDSVMNKLSPPASPNFHLVEFISRAARQARLLIQTTTFSFELQVCTSRPLSPFLAAFNRPV